MSVHKLLIFSALCALTVKGIAQEEGAPQSVVAPVGDSLDQTFTSGGLVHGRPAEIVYYADAYADHYGVPRELVYAVISQESGWKPKAVSNKGAKGLMQLMPATAHRYGVKDPFNISENIGAGVHYLADLINQFQDLRLAVASYYCGSSYPLKRGLEYANPDVVAYVSAIRKHYARELPSTLNKQNTEGVIP
jgi:soluble lytic murein transglycosylase-like protein